MTTIALVLLGLAGLPACLFLWNLALYRRLPRAGIRPASALQRPVSILIPARNEEGSIGAAIDSVLSQRGVQLEVVVLDDHSTDATPEIVARRSLRDPRVRLIQGKSLPDGWCGKQHACWQLARAAAHETLVFMDADVRLAPDAVRRIGDFLEHRPDLHLLSGVPRQWTHSFLEKALIPLIHFILLAYLPLAAARRFRWSAFAAGCGQLFATRRQSYFAAGGHQAIRSSLHDGVTLPRAFRVQGFQTDIFDATDLASCRMYANSIEVWKGLGKNATEGLASPGAILPWTLLLGLGQVGPWVAWLAALLLPTGPEPTALGILACATVLTLLPRLLGAARFRQSLFGALLHPIGVAMLLIIQWQALLRKWVGRPMQWRGRSYVHPSMNPSSSQAPS
ncbi:MAG: glycosyltransferase [Verrucomicrobiales bacterium]|nr:glycosyltransferase [Verrucomicrobiales bacterium]